MAIQFDNTNTGSITLAPATTGSWSLALPTALGTAGQFLTTNAAGVLGYTNSSGGSLTGFSVALNTAAPNATKNVSSFTSVAPSTDAGIALTTKFTGGTAGSITTCIPDNTTVGGNARGSNAIDFQFASQRTAATQVASSSYSAILGGANNTVSGNYSSVLGGNGNSVSGSFSVICGGTGNSVVANQSVIFGGTANLIPSTGSTGPSVIFGGRGGTTAGVQFTALYSGNNWNVDTPKGGTQVRYLPVACAPTSASAVVLDSSGALFSSSVNNTCVIPASTVSFVRAFTIGRRNSALAIRSYQSYILVRRSSAGNVTQAGSVNSTVVLSTLGTAPSWTLTIGVNVARQAVDLNAGGAASQTVPFSAIIHSIDMAAGF